MVAAEIAVLVNITKPELVELQNQAKNLSVKRGNTGTTSSEYDESLIIHCGFQIRIMQAVHDYTAQCIFTKHKIHKTYTQQT